MGKQRETQTDRERQSVREEDHQERLYPYNRYDMRYECMTMEAFNRTPKMAVFIWYLVSRFTFYTIYFVAQRQTT